MSEAVDAVAEMPNGEVSILKSAEDVEVTHPDWMGELVFKRESCGEELGIPLLSVSPNDDLSLRRRMMS